MRRGPVFDLSAALSYKKTRVRLVAITGLSNDTACAKYISALRRLQACQMPQPTQ